MTPSSRRKADPEGSSVDDAEDHMRRFSAPLRVHRARLTLQDVRPGDSGVRKTLGLRREAVTVLSGKSMNWYSWLEQGRDIRPSADVLRALASTLRLTEVERSELFEIAEKVARWPAVRPPRWRARPQDRS